MKTTLTLFSLSILVFACQPKVDEVKAAKIEKLQIRIDSSIQAFNQIDSAKAMQSAIHFDENLKYIKNEYRDTIDNKTALYIDEYYSLRKAFSLIKKDYSKTSTDLTSTNKRLEDLEHDLNNGLIEDTQFNQYIQLESNNVSLIEESTSNIVYAYSVVQPMYDTMNPKVDSLIDESKRKATLAKE